MKTKHRTAARAKRRWQADPFAMFKSIARVSALNTAEQTDCALPVRIAWASMRGGSATPDDMATLTEVMSICLIAAQGMDEFVHVTLDAARVATIAIAERYARVKRFGVDAAALRDIPPMLDFYDELLRNATGGQLEQWLTQATRMKHHARHHSSPADAHAHRAAAA